MIISWIILIIGFVLLGRGANVFVDGAVGIAQRFRVPTIIIGTTLVAIGTSAPEIAISIAAALKGATGVSVGNIIGSNITNIFLILGIAAIFGTLAINKYTKYFELPFVGFITLLMCAIGMYMGEISQFYGFVLLGLFVLFLIYMTCMAYHSQNPVKKIKLMPLSETIVIIIAGIAALIIGANMVTESAAHIARQIGVSERIIGLTLVAFGTSLPELVVCVAATLKREYDIVIGNLVGSNIFNILFVLGTTAIIRPLPFPGDFLIDGAVAIFAVTMLMIFVSQKSKLTRGDGIALLVSYLMYIWYLF